MLPDEILLLLCTKPASINCSSMLLLRLHRFKSFFFLSSRALTMSSNDLQKFKYTSKACKECIISEQDSVNRTWAATINYCNINPHFGMQ